MIEFNPNLNLFFLILN